MQDAHPHVELPDITHLTGLQLKQLRAAIQMCIKSVEDAEVQELRDKIGTLLNDSGYDHGRIFGGKEEAPRQRAKARVKYRNPDDPSETWTGKGKMPKWMQEDMEISGRANKEDYLIEQE